MLKTGFFSALIILFSFLTIQPVFADGINPACPSIYGAQCPTGQLLIDKKIQNPKTGEMVEAINANDIIFVSDQEINFKVEVKNRGTSNLNSIFVQDKLPDYVTFVSGPGSFDNNTKTLNWNIDNLNADEFRVFFIKAKIKPLSELPQASITCLTNFAKTSKDNLSAIDTAVFCIQTPITGKGPQAVLPVEELPKTGLPFVAWSLAGFAPLGFGLRKFLSLRRDNEDKPFYISQKHNFDKTS